MQKFKFFFNNKTCLSCYVCQTACKTAHHLGPEELFRCVKFLHYDQAGKPLPYSGACNHCANPACVAVCPVGAMYKVDGDGAVLHDDGKCIGCGRCVWNCPYGAISFSSKTGLTQKCDSCYARRQEGKNPICVDACPTESLRLKPFSPSKQLAAQELPDYSITNPSTKLPAGSEEEPK